MRFQGQVQLAESTQTRERKREIEKTYATLHSNWPVVGLINKWEVREGENKIESRRCLKQTRLANREFIFYAEWKIK